ncbi:hypothetical protein KA183_17975 [bacterium]|nr:hypothetical protein [bacterium]QQR56382.1 MAG: hypothetical protein IPG59_15390 [Candidatus Melainabacteria bacterium]
MNRKKNFHVAVFIALFALTAAPSLAQGDDSEDWTKFSPPTAEFSIMMPKGVSEATTFNDKNIRFLEYYSDEDNEHYKISQGIHLTEEEKKADAYLRISKGLERTAEKKVLAFKVEKPVKVSGKGWTGERIDSTIGDTNSTLIKAVSTAGDVGYTLNFTGLQGARMSDSFINSFEVKPDIASKAHPVAMSSQEAYAQGNKFGSWVFGALILIMLIAIVVVKLYLETGVSKMFKK